MTSHKPQQHSENGLVCKKTAGAALTAGFFGIAALCGAGTAQAADSARVQWPNNGHYYQRFEGASITWGTAKTSCESRGAHLATITSLNEQGFIQNNLLSSVLDPQRNDYFIGGSYDAITFKWKWITGEAWSYENWLPGSGSSGDYLVINPNPNYHYGTWWNIGGTSTERAYICEWSAQNYISTALVPDMNGNGSAEVAALYVDYKTGKHTVQIKDPKTTKALYTLVFATSFTPPAGMVVLKDIDGNRSPEIGVLSTQYGFPSVQIKDAKTGKTLNNMMFLTPSYKPGSVAVGADADRNGADEIVVLGVHKSTGAAKAEIRDSKTGNVSSNTPF